MLKQLANILARPPQNLPVTTRLILAVIRQKIRDLLFMQAAEKGMLAGIAKTLDKGMTPRQREKFAKVLIKFAKLSIEVGHPPKELLPILQKLAQLRLADMNSALLKKPSVPIASPPKKRAQRTSSTRPLGPLNPRPRPFPKLNLGVEFSQSKMAVQKSAIALTQNKHSTYKSHSLKTRLKFSLNRKLNAAPPFTPARPRFDFLTFPPERTPPPQKSRNSLK